MEGIVIYFGKVILLSAIFWLYYKVFLEGKEFHLYNRFYLLLTIICSLFLPIIRVDWFTISPKNAMLFDFIHLVNGSEQMLVSSPEASSINPLMYLFMLIGLVSILLLGKFVYSIIKISQIKQKFPVEKHPTYDLVLTDLEFAPFTFFKNLFWNTRLDVNTSNGKKIYLHELAHITQGHTIDRIFVQIIKTIFWFNPIFYLIHREIILIHEYLADQKAIADKDSAAFAQMLLDQHFFQSNIQGISPFFSSTIKKRLHMITKKHPTKFSYARRVWALPLFLLVAFTYLVQAKNREIKAVNDKIEAMNEIQFNNLENALIADQPLENDYSDKPIDMKSTDVVMLVMDTVSRNAFAKLLAKFKIGDKLNIAHMSEDEKNKLAQYYSQMTAAEKAEFPDIAVDYEVKSGHVYFKKIKTDATTHSKYKFVDTDEPALESMLVMSRFIKLNYGEIKAEDFLTYFETEEWERALKGMSETDNDLKKYFATQEGAKSLKVLDKLFGDKSNQIAYAKSAKYPDKKDMNKITNPKIIYKVDGKIVSSDSIQLISTEKIERVNVIKNRDAEGNESEQSVIEIETKKEIEYISTDVATKSKHEKQGKAKLHHNPESEYTLQYDGIGNIYTRINPQELTIYINGKKSTQKELEQLEPNQIKDISLDAKSKNNRKKGVIKITTKKK